MLRLEIPNELLLRAISDAVGQHLGHIREYTGYLDTSGACKFLSVGETQFKEWVRLGYIQPFKASSHLVRYRIDELHDFMEQFRVAKRPATRPPAEPNCCQP